MLEVGKVLLMECSVVGIVESGWNHGSGAKLDSAFTWMTNTSGYSTRLPGSNQ